MNPDDLLAWIRQGDKPLDHLTPSSDIKTALGVSALVDDQRQFFEINATFLLDGSLLIRSGSGQDDRGPDTVHLHARQANGNKMPILSGTSLAGALRARALKIANTLDAHGRAQTLINKMFGVEMRPGVQPKASRVTVTEEVVHNAKTDLVQNRVSIDRFTGGARETALFSEQPAFGGDDTMLKVNLKLVNPKDHEVGLLLLLLKDLWTGDLALGGASSVGRGRLKGERATLTHQSDGASRIWEIIFNGQGLTIIGDRAALERFVAALNARLKE
jgi:CRISPR/Cas system CSM-associated protein Csm3 (group 7 of RAMP superfamily)